MRYLDDGKAWKYRYSGNLKKILLSFTEINGGRQWRGLSRLQEELWVFVEGSYIALISFGPDRIMD